MKKYIRKHGVIIAEGITIEKPKIEYTRWNKLLEEWKNKQKEYDIGVEENCGEYLFIYSKQNYIMCDILQLQITELPVYEASVKLKEFINKYEELRYSIPKQYIVHYWR